MRNLALGLLIAWLAACGGDGGNNNVVIVDTQTEPASATCNPLTQTGCAAGEKCANRTLQGQPNPISEIACVPNGTVGEDMPCTNGMPGASGYSNCLGGFECVNAICKKICDHQGGDPKCDANHACSRYEGLFVSNGQTVGGVCDPKCDPLKQELLAGAGNRAACGSTNAAQPTNGCFTFDLIDFTCAGIPTNAKGKTDRMPAYGPPGGGAYVNGCEAGFLPFFNESTGSTVVVCAGLCAPLKTDNTLQANNKGDATALAKMPTEAAPAAGGNATCQVGKKGSQNIENCHFLWPYNNDGMNFLPGPYNDTLGVCRFPGAYSYDHDQNATTPPRQYPQCQMLPPKGFTTNCPGDGCPDGTAADWPCYNSVEANFANGGKINPVLLDSHVGTRAPGVGVRHWVR